MSNGGNTHSTNGGAGWDFFVSYTQPDRPWAEWIAWTLEETGYRVLIQAWDFTPGSNWVTGMDQGVAAAKRTIAVLSAAYTHSVYGAAEWQAAWAAGVDPVEVAGRLRVSTKSAYQWKRRWQAGGVAALASRGPSGASCRLSDRQLDRLRVELDRDPAAHGWPDQRWTLHPHSCPSATPVARLSARVVRRVRRVRRSSGTGDRRRRCLPCQDLPRR
uniref:toll/interleukin-1 receptor domain-containing protein n=1 Tax=Parafrankia elaeagni TaxID=222534 RepID=UPI00039DCF14|nr:toll/interleukin-1 receptor domain-containing protein [Parafrankia elaeagni]